MLTVLGKKELTKILYKTFGRISFVEDDLTSTFWSELYISGSDFFKTDDGLADLDFFWSEDVRKWILADKTEWLKTHNIELE